MRLWWCPLLLLCFQLEASPYNCEYCSGSSGTPTQLTLQDTLKDTLACQWSVHLASLDVRSQSGEVWRSKGYLDPMLHLSASQAWWENNTRQEGLALPDGTSVTLPLLGTLTSHKQAGIRFNGETQKIQAQLSKKMRCGTEFALGTQSCREENPIFILEDPYPSFATSQINYFQKTQTELFFVIKQPLLKGFRYGREVTNEKTQRLQLCASQYQMLWDISKQLFDATAAYWNVVKVQRTLAAREDEEREIEKYFEDVQALVEGRQMGKGELAQVLSSLAQAKAGVMVAQQQLVAAKKRLVLAMGRSEEDCGEDWSILDAFPSIDDAWACHTGAMDLARCEAIHRRPDLVSLCYQVDAAQTGVQGAKNEMLPELNLQVEERLRNSNYQKRASDAIQGYFVKVPRQEFSVALEMTWPIGHTHARGDLRVARSTRDQAVTKVHRLSAEVEADVIQALCNQINISASLRQLMQSTEESRVYVDSQQELFRVSQTSLFQLLDSRRKHTEAQIKQEAVHAEYSTNLAKLRLLMGMVLRCECNNEIIVEDLTEVPSLLVQGVS